MTSESAITSTGSPRVARVRVPGAGLRSDLRAIRVVWQRELIRFSRDRARMVTALVQPILFLFVLGTGLSRLASAGTHGVNLRTFVYPGVLALAVLFTAIVIGKCLGGTTVAGFQGVIMIAIAGLVSVPYSPVMILEVLVLQLLLAFALTGFGVMMAVRMTQMQSFMALMQMVIMPLFFISGALFPVAGLPTWLSVLNRVDPITYAVDPIRRAVFAHLDVSEAARHALAPGVTWWGWHLPGLFEAALVALLGMAMLGIAIWQFSRTE
jgi:ABC-2 type transport system permease protein